MTLPAARAAPHPTTTPSPGRRITAHRYRQARQWAQEQCFTGWPLAERVAAVVAALIEDERGVVHGDDLARALREQDTVDCALDLLGLPTTCPDPTTPASEETP